jgi:uncharacterized protein (DUF362 family)
MEKPDKVQVAVVRGGNRRGAVAQALSLIAGALRDNIMPGAVIVPHLSAGSKPGASTHSDTLSATVDALLAAGAATITVAAASPRPDDRADRYFDRLGYRGEVWGRPVSFDELPLGSDLPAAKDTVALAVSRGDWGFGGRPTLRLIDAFPATNRSGPHPGRWTRPGMVIAGLDALAVDAVAGMLLGNDQTRSGHLEAKALDRIEIVGDRPIRTNWVSRDLLRMHWRARRQWAARSRVRAR